MTQEPFDHILRRYGQDMTLYTAGRPEGETVRAIFQPLRDRGTAQTVPSPLGRREQDRFLYLGPPETEISCGGACVLEVRGERYRPQTAQPIYVGERLSHWWAVFEHRAGEADE